MADELGVLVPSCELQDGRQSDRADRQGEVGPRGDHARVMLDRLGDRALLVLPGGNASTSSLKRGRCHVATPHENGKPKYGRLRIPEPRSMSPGADATLALVGRLPPGYGSLC